MGCRRGDRDAALRPRSGRGRNPAGPGSFDAGQPLVCRFLLRKTGGHTPKFYCVFRDGEVLKVKYGQNPEIHAEVAASRLLLALGAGADRMYLVRKLRCFGCPENPQDLLGCISSPSKAVRRACQPLYGEGWLVCLPGPRREGDPR